MFLTLLALIGAWFGFANPWLHFPVAIFLLPGALILSVSQATSPGQAFRNGLLIALPGYAASLYWLAIPVHDFGGFPWVLALPCPILVGVVLAAYAGIFCLGIYVLGSKNNNLVGPLFSGVLWATLELGRNYFLTGFPWLTLSSAFGPWPWALQLAAWCGAFGLSGILVSMTHLALQRSKKAYFGLICLTLLILFPGLYPLHTPSAEKTAITLVQGNIDQDQKWDPDMQKSTLDTYAQLSREALALQPTDLLIWPETALPFYYQDHIDLTFSLQDTLTQLNTPLLVGAPAYSRTQAHEKAPYVLHNRAYLIGSKGQTLSWYDKEHLVPFGEYVPLDNWLPFLAKLVPGEYEFRPSIYVAPLSLGSMSMGILICYEAIFPELAQVRVTQGANLLINISNDAWFGHSSAPLQHLYLAVLRAIEQNRSLVRGTNTGISAFITPTGKISTHTNIFVPALLHQEDVPLLTKTTFFHDHFHIIQMAFPLLSAGLLAIGLITKRKPIY
ncbi:MAG: apolipoprotein N-acyltransferase [Desulfomicrobium sp.]|nr:apolipoprotein N-acyltransferase [Desulfomicrobium sp.]